MGYTTDFYGKFEIDKPLDEDTYTLIQGICTTRRMKRDVSVLTKLGFGTPDTLGIEGEFFVPKGGRMDDSPKESILDKNNPPKTQPGLWCDWEVTEDKKHIKWSGMEKFYDADRWMDYLVNKILAPRGYVVNGIVNAQGEDPQDQWHIRIHNNLVISQEGYHISFVTDYKSPMEITEFIVEHINFQDKMHASFTFEAVEATPEKTLIRMIKKMLDEEGISYHADDLFNISFPSVSEEN